MERRRFLTAAGGSLAVALAGCTGDSDGNDDGSTGNTPTSTATKTPTATATEDSTETATGEGGSGDVESYSVSIEPMGEVTFDEVPEVWVANNASWADMGLALGLEPPEGVWLTSRFHPQYYDDIPGISVDGDDIRELWGDSGVGKEQFYDIDADVHVADPNFLMNRASWSQADVDEITEQVGPFFGNSIFSRDYPWHQDYRYYSLYEAFEKLAQVFQRTDRYEAYREVHEGFKENLAPAVPVRSERPEAAIIWGGGDEPAEFYPYVFDEGTSFEHVRALKLRDALANTDVKNFHSSRGAIDFETLLEVDPEVILMRGQEVTTATEFEDTVVAYMEDHDVASELTAVQNGDVYRAGGLYMGPITYQVVTERLARDLYDVEEPLFDRERVGEIVAGDI